MYRCIDAFFAERGVMRVDTSLLSVAAGTDPCIEPWTAVGQPARYLQTSPEFQMKRLLAAGSGPIYQIAPVFRQEERGRWHEPEFRMLEWYRPGWYHHALMDEVAELLGALFPSLPTQVRRVTYADAFREFTGLEADERGEAPLRSACARGGVDAPSACTPGEMHDLLLATMVTPKLGIDAPCFLYDFPADKAALARIRDGSPPVAERFELFLSGIELANGFHELTDANEQRARFVADQQLRARQGLPQRPMDEALLDALAAGLPACAGVALGLDRLLALALGKSAVSEVIAFPADRA